MIGLVDLCCKPQPLAIIIIITNSSAAWRAHWVWVFHCVDLTVQLSYSARLVGSQWSELVCAAGTVFNELVVWSLSRDHVPLSRDDTAGCVLHRLHSHKVMSAANLYCWSVFTHWMLCKAQCVVRPSLRPYVWLSHTSIVSKRLNLS